MWCANKYMIVCLSLTIQKWIVIDSKVYDISKFANLHPGGTGVLLTEAIGKLPP